MLFEELLKAERKKGREEGRIDGCRELILDLLEDFGTIPKSLKEKIESENNMNTLKMWRTMAVKAESIDQFMKDIQQKQ